MRKEFLKGLAKCAALVLGVVLVILLGMAALILLFPQFVWSILLYAIAGEILLFGIAVVGILATTCRRGKTAG